MTVPVQRVTGLQGVMGSDFHHELNQLFFVEFEGMVSSLSLFSPATVISAGTVLLNGTYTFDLDRGLHGTAGPEADIWWNQKTAMNRQMVPQNNARLLNVGVVDFEAITPAALQTLIYSSEPIYASQDSENQLVPGDVFAVKTKQGNYAKVKVLAYGYDIRIEWVTYRLEPAYKVLGTGYHHPQDIRLSSDQAHAYVTERTGNLLRVAWNQPHRRSAAVITAGLSAPHQIALDEIHQAAYVVESGAAGRVVKVDLVHGSQTEILDHLDHPVGIVLSRDFQFAYISEQTTGPDHGRISRVQLNTGWRHTLVKGLTAPFYLTWADDKQTALLVAEREPANRITCIDVITGASHTLLSHVPMHPSSVQCVQPGRWLVCSDSIIEDVDALPVIPAATEPERPLLIGIGLIGAGQIKPSGMADFLSFPDGASCFHPAKDVPFGGILPLMINHSRAFEKGATHYCVKVSGVPQFFAWSDEKWNGTRFEAHITGPVSVAGHAGYYPVRPLSETGIWKTPLLGGLMPTGHLTPGLHTVVVEFINYAGNQVESSELLTLMIDNHLCMARLAAPVVNAQKPNPISGVLHYTDKNSEEITLPFTANHPKGFASVSFQWVKGAHTVPLPEKLSLLSLVQVVNKGPATVTDRVSHLLGGSVVAGYVAYLHVESRAHNGWERQNQFDASDRLAFVLAP